MEYNSSKELNSCSTYISLTSPEGHQSTASGFFLKFSNRSDIFLVTNKHVIEGKKDISILFSTTLNEPVYGYIQNPFQEAYLHPESKIDLCLLSLSGIILTGDATWNDITSKYICEDMIISIEESTQFNYVEDIIMFGAPKSICDPQKSFKIASKGITATPINGFLENSNDFFVDIAAYAGSSGSPIFLCNEYTMSRFDRTKLVGIFYNVQLDPEDKSKSLHLGRAIHAWRLLDFKNVV